MKKLCLLILLPVQLFSQSVEKQIHITAVAGEKKIAIMVGNQPFTEFIFPDSLEKPVLYPIYAPDGQIITRGFPVAPRPGEPTDHPHHLGLWFNYENVNGLDFWNNSFAIPSDRKHLYGRIKTTGIEQTKSGKKGILTYKANWVDQQGNILLSETTTFIFSADDHQRTIDRSTLLIAQQDVSLEDAKDGLLGLRVAHQLELPSKETRQFTDNKGNVTSVTANSGPAVTGNYLTSEGKQGDSAWATRGVWCLLYGKMGDDTISIAMVDYPGNPGYPTFWHARGYGLFSANPLGQKIFSNGKLALHYKLKKGESASFRYRIIIAADKNRISTEILDQAASAFALIK